MNLWKSRHIPILISTVGTALCLAALTLNANSFDGLNGRQILELIRSDWRPTTTLPLPEDQKQVMARYCRLAEGAYRDYFSQSPLMSTSEFQVISVVSTDWFGETSNDYTLAKNDLHNLLPGNNAVNANRRDFPPGLVLRPSYDNGYWRSGEGEIAGMATNLFEPADELKGDFARIFMYVAAVYPQELWYNRAAMLFADGYYPLLTAYGRQLLLQWHRDDPVDRDELKRNEAIALAQGLGNPFVTNPEIAEYIWGRNSDEIYHPSGGSDDDDDGDKDDDGDQGNDKPAIEPIMLKSHYSVQSDGRIDFRSPYVPSGAKWTFDGRDVDGQSLNLTDVSIGRHEISYRTDRWNGRIIITVEP